MNRSQLHKQSPKVTLRATLLLLPFFVLAFSRIAVELNLLLLPHHLAWIPSFATYYVLIGFSTYLLWRHHDIQVTDQLSIRLQPLPPIKLLFWGILFPALLPLPVFILNLNHVPNIFFFYILLFSLINPIFEELFWRGLLFYLPIRPRYKYLFSGVLFSFSHYFLWGAWFEGPLVIGPTLFSTFLMGYLWMWFTERQKNLLYPILAHLLVDILNLSVAAYAGLLPF